MRKALFCAAMAAALFPATASADVFEGSTTDAVGETTPARDIAAISARYDEAARATRPISVTARGAGRRRPRTRSLAAIAQQGLRREPARGASGPRCSGTTGSIRPTP